MNEVEALKKELVATKLAYQTAREISHFKSGFLGRVAHELRSPLSSLMGLQQLILYDLCEDREEEKSFLQQGYEAAQKLLTMIDEVVLVSKIDDGTIPLNLERVNLAEILTELADLTKLAIANHHLSLKMVFPPPNILIEVDRNYLLKTLILLLDIGIYFKPQKDFTLYTETLRLSQQINIVIQFPGSIEQLKNPEIDLLQLEDLSLKKLEYFNHHLEYSVAMKLLLIKSLIANMSGELQTSEEYDSNLSEPLISFKCQFPFLPTD